MTIVDRTNGRTTDNLRPLYIGTQYQEQAGQTVHREGRDATDRQREMLTTTYPRLDPLTTIVFVQDTNSDFLKTKKTLTFKRRVNEDKVILSRYVGLETTIKRGKGCLVIGYKKPL